ncbi:hypothetical protein Ahia01_001074800 [Argonauta hians]
MLPDYQALSWVVLCPIAIVTNCFGAIIISHYRSSYIGTDMVLITLLLAMAANAGVLLLVPAVYVMLNIAWTVKFCFFYIWIFGFLRAVGLIGLFVLSFHWSHVSKLTPLNRIQAPRFPIKSSILVTVIISVIVGILPLARIFMRPDPFASALPCKFLSYDADPTLAIFAIIMILVVFFAIIICLIDSGLLLHSYKSMFLLKYKSGGYYDTERARAMWSRTGIVSDTYSEIQNTFDLWRVVLLQFLLSTLINHIPYLCIEFVQLFSLDAHTEILMLTVQWLQMMECMLFPFTLLFGARYRHAFSHICRYIFLCDRSTCEKETTCKLQSYRLKAHVQEQNSKFQENLASMADKSHKKKAAVAVTVEDESPVMSDQDTKTEVQADVHICSTSPNRHLLNVSTPRRKMSRQSQANINLNLDRATSTSLLPTIAIKQQQHLQQQAPVSPSMVSVSKSPQHSSSTITVAVYDNIAFNYDPNNTTPTNPTKKISPKISPQINPSKNSNKNNNNKDDAGDDDDEDEVQFTESSLNTWNISSPTDSEDSSSAHTSQLFDDDDIAEVLDRSPSPPPYPVTPPPPTPPDGYERKGPSPKSAAPVAAAVADTVAAATAAVICTTATSTSSNYGNVGADAINIYDKIQESTRTVPAGSPRAAKTPPKGQPGPTQGGDIWTSKSQCLPPGPTGISFDVHGAKPYFEPISENSSTVSEDVHSTGPQSGLYKSKPPYMRSESFLQAVSSSSAFGKDSKPVPKLKFLSKVIMSFSRLRSKTFQSGSSSMHSFKPKGGSPKGGMFPMFSPENKAEEEDEVPRYTLMPQSDSQSRRKSVVVPPHRNSPVGNTERSFKEDVLGDSQSVTLSTTTSVTSLLNSNTFSKKDQKSRKSLAGIINMGAEFPGDSAAAAATAAAGTRKDSPNTDGKTGEMSMDGGTKLENCVPGSPGDEKASLENENLRPSSQENTPVFKRKLPVPPPPPHLYKTMAGAGDKKKISSQNTTPTIAAKPNSTTATTATSTTTPTQPAKTKSPPFPPPPPPPLPTPPPPPPPPPPPLPSFALEPKPADVRPKDHKGRPSKNSQSRSSKEEEEEEEDVNRSSLITAELLASHDIIKRLRGQTDNQLEDTEGQTMVLSADQVCIETPTATPPLQSDEDKSVSDFVHDPFLLSSSSRMYRSVSDESIFSHIGSETKEMPPSLTKATDDLSMAGFSDINRSLFWPNLKDTRQGTRSANDLHLIAYVPPIASRTIPVQKVKALQATSPERSINSKCDSSGYESGKKISEDDEEEDQEEPSEASSSDSLKYLKILKKIEQEPDKEKVERLRRELMEVNSLRTSPVFIRKLEKELMARKSSAEKVEKPIMASVQTVEGPEKLLPQPSSVYNIDDGSPQALRKFLADVIAQRQNLAPSTTASSQSSPFGTPPQSPAYLSSKPTSDKTVSPGRRHSSDAIIDVKTVV